ncbi:cytochrome P450 [Micromonospora sp. NPDC005173]|uniref:cytochrome P450 n=1 Tax=Micromonospora sp. NPDC005173 TaxID=3157165 RepID=UPI0033BD5B18
MSPAGRVLPARMDPLSPEVVADPYPTYARMRAAGPLCRFGPASWGVTRHRDVAALLRDRRLSNTFPEDDPQFRMAQDLSRDVFRRIIPTRDPDDHSRLHQQIVRAFSPGVARRTAGRVGELVDELLAPALDTGRLDAVAELAFPVAATVVCELIGLPAGRTRAEVWPRSTALGRAFTPFLPEADRAAADEALAWLRGYVRDLLTGRRADPDGDLLDRMLAVADPAEGIEEVVDNIVFLCFTGYETTMNMVCTGSIALAQRPDEWRRLRDDPALAATAAEEFVRFDAPIQYTARLALEPIPVGDRVIRPGRSVFLLLGCANHDEDVFADPGRVDIGRHPNPHVGFGGGVRGCLGAALARIEGAVVFDRLARRLAGIDLAAEPVREPNALFRSYESIPLAVTPA